jgi:hypothetical protein
VQVKGYRARGVGGWISCLDGDTFGVMPQRNRFWGGTWRLNSPAARDVQWFFRCSGAELGFRAAPFGPTAETLVVPSLYVPTSKLCVKCCKPAGLEVKSCPSCGGIRFRLPKRIPEQHIAVHPSKGVASRSSTEKPDRVLANVPRERRIRLGLQAVPAETYHVLELAYAGPQLTSEIRARLNPFPFLAMLLPDSTAECIEGKRLSGGKGPTCLQAYASYLDGWHKRNKPSASCQTPLAARWAHREGLVVASTGKQIEAPMMERPLELGDWLSVLCQKSPQPPELAVWKARAMAFVCLALDVYAEVRIAPGPSERTLRRREQHRVPFLFGGDNA